jgi:DNA polymerase III subunit delta'
MQAAWPLLGHTAAEAIFLDAVSRGQLHHAWLIEGPRGIGKMRFAERLAAYLFGATGDPLGAPADDPVMRALMSGGHPDYRSLAREPNDKGKLKQDISVEQVRDFIQFFTLKPALGGWRIGLIDALDDLNASGANALLKTLEEPPPQSVLFLIYHASLPILPTIRSRCRVLRLAPLTPADTEAALILAGAPREALELARGRPGHGIRLASPAGIAATHAARALLRGMPKPKDSALIAALQTANADPVAVEAFQEAVLDWLRTEAEAGNAVAAEVWLETARLFGEAEALNMEPAQMVAKTLAGLYRVGASQ